MPTTQYQDQLEELITTFASICNALRELAVSSRKPRIAMVYTIECLALVLRLVQGLRSAYVAGRAVVAVPGGWIRFEMGANLGAGHEQGNGYDHGNAHNHVNGHGNPHGHGHDYSNGSGPHRGSIHIQAHTHGHGAGHLAAPYGPTHATTPTPTQTTPTPSSTSESAYHLDAAQLELEVEVEAALRAAMEFSASEAVPGLWMGATPMGRRLRKTTLAGDAMAVTCIGTYLGALAKPRTRPAHPPVSL